MQNWNDEIQMITAEHRRRKCYSVIAIILAVVVALSVFGSLILPAISMTWDSTWTSDTTGSFVSTEDIVDDDGDTGQNLTAPLHNAAVQSLSVYSDTDINLASYVTDVTSGYTGEEIYADSAEEVSFTLTYSGLPLTSKTLYYELPEGLIPISGSSSSGSTTTTSDAWFSYSGTRVTGSYEIVQDPDTDKYYIILTYTDDYYNWVQSNTTGTINGGVEFSGSVERAETASGDRTLSFQTSVGYKDLTFNFSDADLTMKKEATSVTGSDGSVTVTWTITIKNSDGLWNLEGKTLTDVISNVQGISTSIDTTSISVTPAEAVASNSNGNFTFASTEGIETITIQYNTTVTGSFNGDQLTNTASLTYGDDNDHTISSSASVTLKEIAISKSGQTDYSVSSDNIEGNIDWTITVQDQYGGYLNGAVIADELFAEAIDSSISVKDESGNDVAFTYDATNHTITIDSSATAKKVIITYSTKAVDMEQGNAQKTVTNTATVKKGTLEDSASASVTYNESEIYTLTKSGVYDNDTKQLTWSITISTGNNNNHTLNNYEITDTKFSGMDASKIEVYAATSQWSGWADASASVSISGDTLTISTTNAKYIVLTYTETIDDLSKYGSSGTYTFTNTVSDQYKDTYTATVGYTPRNEFIKASSVETVTEIGKGSSDLTVNWTIYWTNDNGFNNETIYDKLDDGLTLVEDSIKVEVSTDGINWDTLTKDVDYTLSTTSSDYTFSLSGIRSTYHYLRVTYQTTSDLSSATFAEGASSYEKRFTNEAWYNGMTGDHVTNGFDYTLRNPEDVSTLDITINKTWDTSKGYDGKIITSSGGSVDVSFYILRRDVNSNEWVYLKQDGNTYVEVSDKSEATQFTTSSLTTTITGLPAEVFVQDDTTGAWTSTTYVYKVEEVDSVNGYTISDQYDTTYGNNNIIESSVSKTIDVTNTYRAFYYKTAIDSNGNEISTINMADLPTIVENGETYYLVNWKIAFYDGNQTDVTDILPDHFELVYTGESNDGSWQTGVGVDTVFIGDGTKGSNTTTGFGDEGKVYKYIINPFYLWSSDGMFIGNGSAHAFTISDDGSTVIFKKDTGYYDVYFSTKISEEDLYAYYTDENSFDADGNLIGNIVLYNTATSEGGVSDTAKLTITPKEPVVSEGEYISKYFEPNVKYSDADRYDIYYTLDVNPDGYTLSSSGTIDVTDTLTKVVDDNGNPLSVLLQSINVYTVDGDGNKTLLDAGSYSYNVEYNLEDVSRPEPTVLDVPTGTSISQTYTNVESVTFRLKSGFTYTGSGWFAFKLNGIDDLYLHLSVSNGCATYESGNAKYTIDGYDVTILTADSGYTNITSIAIEGGNSFSDAVESITINYGSESGSTTPAQITFTLPDATHIYIEYHYTLVDVDSNITVNMTNSATVSTNQVEETVTCDNNNVWIAHSSAYVEADGFPVLYKTNVAATSTHLATQFYLLKYDSESGNWLYATGVTQSTDSSGSTVTDSSGNPIYTCSGWTDSKDSASCIEMTSNGFRFNSFESGGLYCFMEVSTATDPNDDTAIYATINEEDPYYYYFTYCGSASDYSGVTGVNGETITIDTTSLATTNGGAVNVPNNKLITIQAQKLWDNAETWLSGASVELTLMSSSTRSITGVPSDAVAVEDTTNDNPQTLTSAGSTAEWTILPNGSDGKPIYYYVVETAYTVNGTTYTLADDGKYYDADGNEGDYTASYSSMAIVDNAIFDTDAGTSGVTVNNSSGLTVAKRWTDVDNKTTSAYLDYISFILYGTTEDGNEEQIGTGTLNDSNNWMIHIGSSDSSFTFESGISADNLGSYTSFRVVEVQEYTDENGSTSYPLYGYTISYILQVTDGQGVITIVNKNNTQTTCSVSVEKVWGSGTSGMETPITVTLYQGTSNSYSISDIANMSEDERKEAGFTTTIYTYDTSDEGEGSNSELVTNPVSLGGNDSSYDSTSLKYTWSNLPYTNEDGVRYYYYVVETSPSETGDWEASYTTVSGANPKYTITNYVPGVLEVEKKWVAGNTELTEEEASNYTAKFAIYRNRTASDPATTNALQQLSAVNGGTGSIIVDTIGDSITCGKYNDIEETYRYPTQLQSMLTSYGYSATVNNYGIDGYTTAEIQSSEVGEISTNADVVCILSGTNDVLHCSDIYTLSGVDNIKSLITAVYDQVTNKDVVVLVGSIPHFNFVDEDANTVNAVYSWPWCTWQFSDYSKISSTNIDEALAAAQGWEDFMNGYVDNFNADIQTAVAELQATYPTLQFVDVCSAVDKDTMLYDGVHPNEIGYAAIATAFYQAIIDEMPDTDTGTEDDTSGSDDSSTVVNNGMPSDFYTYDEDGNVTGINLEDYIQVEITKENIKSANVEIDTDGTFELNSSNNWSASFTGLPTADDNGTKYKYYVVEVDGHKTQTLSTQTIADGWTVSYDGEGVIIGDDGSVSGSITITNTLDVIDLSIEKFWNDLGAETANDHIGSTVTVTLYRTTNPLSDAQTSRLILEDEHGNAIADDEGITLSTSGSGTTIYTTTPISSISYDTSLFSITYDCGTCSFSIRVADGVDATGGDISTTITVTDTNGTSKVLEITITNLAPLTLSDSSLSLIAGIGETVTASVSSGTITSLIVPDGDFYDVTINDNTFTIIGTATGTDTITIQALCNGSDGCGDGKYHEAQLTITINLPQTFTIEGGDSVDIDGTLQLTPEPNYGTFTWSSSDTSIATVDGNGLVTGIAAGSATITATREDNVTATITITVNEAATQKTLTNVTDPLEIDTSRPVDSIEFIITGINWSEATLKITTSSGTTEFKVGFFNGDEYAGDELAVEVGNTEYVEYTDSVYTLTATSGQKSPATLTLTVNNPSCLTAVQWATNSGKDLFTSISYTVHYAATAKTSLTTYASTIAPYATDYSQYGEAIGTYTISGNENSDWTLQLSDLLKYDPDGNPYYYYVVETDISGGYTATYWYGGETCINAASCSSDSPGEIQIENVRTESTNIALPSTGGDGTSGFVAAGIACITTASIGTILNLTWRRKRQHNGVTRHGKE